MPLCSCGCGRDTSYHKINPQQLPLFPELAEGGEVPESDTPGEAPASPATPSADSD